MVKCKLCQKTFSSLKNLSRHIRYHNISSHEYYDRFLKKKNEGICYCGNKAIYNNLLAGYGRYCSMLCAQASLEVKKKRAKSCLKHFGCKNPMQNSSIRNKVYNTCAKLYGKRYRLEFSNKRTSTLIKKHGSIKKAYNTFKDKRIKTTLKKYGVKYAVCNDKVRKKREVTNIRRYGNISPLSNEKVRKKMELTNIERYGFSNVSKSKKIINKSKETCLLKYGYTSWMKSKDGRLKSSSIQRNPKIHEKIFASRKKKNHGYLSNSEYLFSKRLKNTFYFKSEYFLNGHHFDFAIFRSGKLDTLVEIDGEYFHGLLNDCDGKFVRGDADHYRFSLVPKGVKFLVIDSKKIKEGFNELRRIYRMSYKEFIKDMINSIPKSIPYYSFSKERMRKDYEHLCHYKYRNNANLGRSIILNYCKSIFDSLDWSKRKELIKEHRIYYSPVSSHNPLDGLIEIKNISKLREKYRKKYKGKKEVEHKKYSPEKMLAICSLNKSYSCNCKNKSEFNEAMKIIKLLNLKATIKER